MRKPEDTIFPYRTTNAPAMYDQAYVDMLELELKHYQRLYRDELKKNLKLRKIT